MEIALKSGGHQKREDGMCLMEAVAFLAGEPHSDHPACADSVLGAFGRVLNDAMTDEERVLLAPLASKLIGTAGGPELSLRRAMLLCDGVVRQIVPIVLEGVGLADRARALRDLKEITDQESAIAAWSAARSAARSAASAAWSAAHLTVMKQLVELFAAAMEIK